MSHELTLQQGKWNGKERRMKYQSEQQCGPKAKLCNWRAVTNHLNRRRVQRTGQQLKPTLKSS